MCIQESVKVNVCGVAKFNRIRNALIRGNLGVTDVVGKMKKTVRDFEKLRQYGSIYKRFQVHDRWNMSCGKRRNRLRLLGNTWREHVV